MSTNNLSTRLPLGQFYGDRKLYTAPMPEFFTQEDPRNPSGSEPNWDQVVAGPPLADSAEVLEHSVRQGYAGIYGRLTGATTDIPEDHDPHRGQLQLP